MSEVTLDSVVSMQTQINAAIQRLQQAAQTRTISIPAATITLQPGEHYAGAVLDENGGHLHHLVLMAARPDKKLNWQAACDWAESIGGDLPDRQEQALLYANCKPHLKPEWHWSGVTHEDDASYAWDCHFSSGHQISTRKSFEGCAVAVRRV